MTAQVWLNTNLVRLQKAVLCANCEVISEGLNGHCAGCGSQSLLSLSRVLGGTIEPELSFAFTTSVQTLRNDEQVCFLSAAA
jgi:hypothetical protein